MVPGNHFLVSRIIYVLDHKSMIAELTFIMANVIKECSYSGVILILEVF